MAGVQDVGEIRVVDAVQQAQDVVAGAGHVAVVVVLEAHHNALVPAVGGHFLHGLDHRRPERLLVGAILRDVGREDADERHAR